MELEAESEVEPNVEVEADAEVQRQAGVMVRPRVVLDRLCSPAMSVYTRRRKLTYLGVRCGFG